MPDSTQPKIPDSELDAEPTDDGEVDPSSGLGISRRKAFLMLGLVVVASIIIWRLREVEGQSKSSQEIEAALREDLAGETATEEGEITVPVAPNDELEKDAAVIDALKERGRMDGAS